MANEIKLFAGPSTNTLTPAAWASLTTLLANGFQSGLASSEQANTLFRQLSTVAAGIGQFISGQGFDALDNGDINAFATAFSSAMRKAALPSGIILMSGAGTAPAGAVKLNGAVISITTTTQSLVDAVYCGDGNNTTAEFFYKCTNPASPSATRSTAGTYFVLEDTRGRFPRSWTDGGSIDAGRSLWAMQAASNLAHSHAMLASSAQGGAKAITDAVANGVMGASGASSNYQVAPGGQPASDLVASSGSANARPDNFPCLFSITL